jgi:hypothetical protein
MINRALTSLQYLLVKVIIDSSSKSSFIFFIIDFLGIGNFSSKTKIKDLKTK